MLNRMRLIFTGLFLSLALVACSDDNTATTNNNEADTSAPVATVDSAPEATAETSTDGIQAGTSREELVSTYGEPDIAQERQLDAMNIEILEWHNDDALIVAQLLDGKVTYGRIVPKSE